MTHEDEKIDQSFSRRRIQFQSRSEYQAFCRIAPDGIPATHKFVIEHVQPTPEALKKNPALLPTVEMGCIPLGIKDIGERTHDFEDLSTIQLKWLTETYGITQDPPPVDATGKPIPMPRLTEKEALIAALRKHLKTETAKPAKGEEKKPQTPVISPTVAAMSEAQMETEAAKLGVYEQFKKLRGRPVVERRMLISKAIAEKGEAVTT